MKHIQGKYTKLIAISGISTVTAMLLCSMLLYAGAGIYFDYLSAVAVSFSLIEAIRPLSVICATGCISIEYTHRKSP